MEEGKARRMVMENGTESWERYPQEAEEREQKERNDAPEELNTLHRSALKSLVIRRV